MDNYKLQFSLFLMDLFDGCPQGEHALVFSGYHQMVIQYRFKKVGNEIVDLERHSTLDSFVETACAKLVANEKLIVSLYTHNHENYEVRSWGLTEHNYSVIPVSALNKMDANFNDEKFVFHDSWD